MQFYPSGTRIAGRFEVTGAPLLGGMGVVYLCFDHQEQRPVALKTFRPEFLPDRVARERFLQEGETWMRLGKHPHIVRCYEVFRDHPRPEVFLVLELIAKGESRRDASLRSWLTPGRPLPTEQALLIALQIVRGMKHATDTISGFVHRDLKPENVLVGADWLTNAAVNRARVTDFGLVKGLRAEQVAAPDAEDLIPQPGHLTQVASVVGTPQYMAPEQWEGAGVAVQTDIYALGCILGEMLTGRMLVLGQTLDELRRAHQSGQALAVARAAPAALADLLGGCLATDPPQRYDGWGAVEAALAAIYHTATGQSAPELEKTAAFSRPERVATSLSYNEIGNSYLQMGNAQAALDYFERAYQAGQAEEEPLLTAASLAHLGNACAQLGNARRAIACYESALAIHRKIAYRGGEGAALGNLGSAYLQLGDARGAIGYHEQALAIHRETGDRRGEGNDLNNLGHACQQLGVFWRAIDYHEQALAIRRELGDRLGEGIDLGNLGTVYVRMGDAQRAIVYLEQALALGQENGDRRAEGINLSNLGLAYKHLGEVQRAIAYSEQALTIAREISDRRFEGLGLGNLGSAYEELGDTRRAIVYYEQALAIAREISDRYGEGIHLTNLGRACAQLGYAGRAIAYYRSALAIHREIGDRPSEGKTIGNLGSAYLQLEDARQAIDSYKQALAIHRELGDRRGEGTYLLGLGNAYGRLGDSRRAIDYYEQALGIHREIGDVLTAAMCSANLGWALAQIGHVNEAVDLLQQAVRDFQQAGHPQQAQPALRILAELQSEEPSGPTNSPNTAEILSQFAPVIEDTVAAARGIHTAKAALDQAFPMLTQKGWQLTEPIHRIWAGERDAGKLTAGLNESESIIIHEILRQL